MAFLLPDYRFARSTDLTPGFLRAAGIDALLIDIDNTLAPYETAEPDEALLRWFGALGQAGIRAALISNNDAARVSRFNAALGLPAYPDAHKPLPGTARRALAALGAAPARAAALGDQLFTDLLCARLCGMRAILVPPIRDKRTAAFRVKRALERPILAVWRRKNGGEFTTITQKEE